MTRDCQDTGGKLMNGASGGLAVGTDVVIGSDVEVRLGSAALVVAKCIVDEKSCRENEHGGEECDCVHSCIFLIVNIIVCLS